jgi:methylated-DNA-[protein]-cysteine S-methyltransferase
MKKQFKDKVLTLVKQIPKGKITTYKIIANKLNSKAYRAVGSILKNNEQPLKIPCHRVIKSNGSVGGYLGKINNNQKSKLLKKEGINIINNKININKYVYYFN